MARNSLISHQTNMRIDNGDQDQTVTRPRRRNSQTNPTNRIHTIRYRPTLEDRIVDFAEGQSIPMHNLIFDNNANHAEMLFEIHANRIVSKMEEDPDLMENNIESENLRKEALRHMPQCLTVKRCIKRKLTKSVSRRKVGRPIGIFKSMHYRLSFRYSQMKTYVKNLFYTYELWYDSLKTIEGNFGSGTSSYFKFLRWIFLMNVSVMVVTLFFIIVPQVTFRDIVGQIDNMKQFRVWDIFTGEGSFSNTLLYYGFYSNQTVNFYGVSYNMPYAYFYTMLFLYFVSFVVLSYSVAISYRKSFIETEGGLKNIFANKVFCGWDFSIATKEAADLKSKSIYNDLKELLSELHLNNDDIPLLKRIKTTFVQVLANILLLIFFGLIGFCLWTLMEMHRTDQIGPILIAVTANFFNVIVPMMFTKMASYENYNNPRNSVGITLIRSFLLSFVIVGTLVAFWLMHSFTQECWETSLGQEMYRLILFDFILSFLIHAVSVLFFVINRFHRKVISSYEFDVASNTLDLIYSQSLFWMGFFFAPMLAVVVPLKLLLTWYLKQYYLLKVCKPSTKAWRASQTQTWFLTLTFLTLLATGGLMVFILLKIPTTSCGPFQGYMYFYELVLWGVDKNTFLPFRYIGYLTKPGVVSLIMVAICARVYYVRERANAQRDMVKILRNMLVWESKDKEFLLEYISKVTKGEWKYNIRDCRYEDPYITAPDMDNSHQSNFEQTGTSIPTRNHSSTLDSGDVQ